MESEYRFIDTWGVQEQRPSKRLCINLNMKLNNQSPEDPRVGKGRYDQGTPIRERQGIRDKNQNQSLIE